MSRHMSWTVLFVWEARPSKDHLDLPLSFRSVRYLDVFNGLRQRPGVVSSIHYALDFTY